MRHIATKHAPSALGPYAQAVVSNGLVITSGQVALTLDGELLKGSIEDETHQVMRNLDAILAAAGVGFGDVLKAVVYVTDTSLFAQVNAVYGGYFGDGPYPAREFVGVASLPLGARIEISMIARLPESPKQKAKA